MIHKTHFFICKKPIAYYSSSLFARKLFLGVIYYLAFPVKILVRSKV